LSFVSDAALRTKGTRPRRKEEGGKTRERIRLRMSFIIGTVSINQRLTSTILSHSNGAVSVRPLGVVITLGLQKSGKSEEEEEDDETRSINYH